MLAMWSRASSSLLSKVAHEVVDSNPVAPFHHFFQRRGLSYYALDNYALTHLANTNSSYARIIL